MKMNKIFTAFRATRATYIYRLLPFLPFGVALTALHVALSEKCINKGFSDYVYFLVALVALNELP